MFRTFKVWMTAAALITPLSPCIAKMNVEQGPDTLTLENDFLKATLSARGGQLVSLYDKASGLDYAFSPAVTDGGLGADRIWEKAEWSELMNARFELEIVSSTPEGAVVRAKCRATGGPAKGMDFVHTYTLRSDECRLKLRWQIFANEHWAEFSPWSKNLVLLPPDLKSKDRTAVFCQSARGLYAEFPIRPSHGQALIFDLVEPWIGAVSEASGNGLCIVTDARALNHFYCWYGAEHFFTAEPIFKKYSFAPGGSWAADIWYIPTRGVGRYHLATPEYVAGLSPAGLDLFPAVALPAAKVRLAMGAESVDCAPSDLKAGKARSFPFNAPAGTGDLKVRLQSGDRETRHTVRASSVQAPSEFNPELNEFKTDVAPADSAIATFSKDTLYLSPDLTVSVHFGMAASFKEELRQVELVLDLPESVRLFSPDVPPIKGETIRDGVTYRTYRFKVSARTYYNVCDMFMSTDLPPGERAQMFYRVVWENGEQEPQKLAIESVRVEACKRIPRRLVAGLGFYGLDVLSRWPDIHANLKRVGLNALSFNDKDYSRIPEMRAAVLRAKELGMFMAANYSPTCHQMPPDAPADSKAQAMDGFRSGFICPSYRGPLFEEEIARASSYGEAGASIIYWDAESWRGREFCFCPRCLERFKDYLARNHPGVAPVSPKVFEQDLQKYPGYHDLWIAFRISMGTELFSLYKNEYLRRLKASGITGTGPEEILVGNYDVMPGRVYHQFQRFDEQYAAGAINICMPSLYFGGDAKRIGEGVRDVRRVLGHSRIIPWICGGDDEPRESLGLEQKYVLLELFLNGAMGFTTWPYVGWDAQDMKYVSQVMNLIVPIEDLIVDGVVMEALSTSDEKIHATGLRKEGEAALLISSYYSNELPPVTLNLDFPVPAKLFDVATGAELATVRAGANILAIPAYPEKARLLYIGAKAPDLSYPCPPAGKAPGSALSP